LSFSVWQAGICAAGSTSTTIRLARGSSTDDDFYNGSTVEITAGLGNGQSKVLTDYAYTAPAYPSPAYYTGTVSTWTTTPDITSVYRIYEVELPLTPFRCKETGPARIKTGDLPGGEPFLISEGLKGTQLIVEGYIYESGQTLAQLKTSYIDPLRFLRYKQVELDTPDSMYDGFYIFEDFQFDQAYQHPAGFKYKMLFKKGSLFAVL